MKQKTTEEKKKHNQKLKQLGFQKGMLGKSVSKKLANTNKGKGNKKERQKKPK